jgi:hypothetical protein
METAFRTLARLGPADVLAIVAIVFAIIQFIDARIESARMEHLARSMSTRFAGRFPKNLTEILNVVQSADKELLIMADFLNYGSYTAPDLFLALKSAIEKNCLKGVTVKILRYDDQRAKEALMEQLPVRLFNEDKKSSRFKGFCERHNLVDPTYEDLIAELLKNQESTEKFLIETAGVKVRVAMDNLPMFLWLEDEEDAVFVFRYPGLPDRGFSFRTRDGSLISNFHQPFESHWNKGKEIQSI